MFSCNGFSLSSRVFKNEFKSLNKGYVYLIPKFGTISNKSSDSKGYQCYLKKEKNYPA